jgi:hypothetical protein
VQSFSGPCPSDASTANEEEIVISCCIRLSCCAVLYSGELRLCLLVAEIVCIWAVWRANGIVRNGRAALAGCMHVPIVADQSGPYDLVATLIGVRCMCGRGVCILAFGDGVRAAVRRKQQRVRGIRRT